MKLCEKCVMKHEPEPCEAAYAVTLNGWSRDLMLCGHCMNEESVQENVVSYKVIPEREPFSLVFWITMAVLGAIAGNLIWRIWYG